MVTETETQDEQQTSLHSASTKPSKNNNYLDRVYIWSVCIGLSYCIHTYVYIYDRNKTFVHIEQIGFF